MRAAALREDIRDLILDAAERLVAHYGYRKMTMDDLAREVGIGKGTIYLHFSSKEEVVLSYIDRLVSRLKERLREIASSKQSPPERIRQMLLARVLFRLDSVQNYRLSMDDLLGAIRPALFARRERHFQEEAEIFAKVLKEGQAVGVFTLKKPLLTAHTLLLATNSLLPYGLSVREFGARREIEEKTARIADLLLHGLCSPPRALSKKRRQ